MNQSGMDEEMKHFLLGLFEAVDADVSAKASLYEIGEALGMERDRANFIATELIGFGYAEIKTLSGGLGITEDGIAAARKMGAGDDAPEEGKARLGDEPILDDRSKEACDTITTGLKSEVGKLGLDFDAISEITADLKTIDAQLNSPKPKSAIVRECFRSIRSVLQKAGAGEPVDRIEGFIGQGGRN